MIVKVGAIDYAIHTSANGLDPEDSEGYCNKNTGAIFVKPGRNPRMMACTILHELMHACWAAAGLPDPVKNMTEEDIVNHLSHTWAALMRDNPAVLAIIVDALVDNTEMPI